MGLWGFEAPGLLSINAQPRSKIMGLRIGFRVYRVLGFMGVSSVRRGGGVAVGFKMESSCPPLNPKP